MYKSDLQSSEENLNDAELGQELINWLLRTGEIKEKSAKPSIQNAALIKKYEQIKSDRYDELIAAFNVILEEILHQSNASTKDAVQQPDVSSNTSNHINDQETDAIKQSDEMCKTEMNTKNRPSFRNQMNRCLNQFEKELLQKIKDLTNQLNSAMNKRKTHESDEELNDESSQRDRRQLRLYVDNS